MDKSTINRKAKWRINKIKTIQHKNNAVAFNLSMHKDK